jgi:hypothetical protein
MPTLRRLAAVVALLAAACYRPTVPPEGAPRLTSQVRGPFDFAVIGDFGSGDANERAVAEAIRAQAQGLEALVTTGDNVYENGHPGRFDEAWHEPYGWVEEEDVEVVAALGNHDVRTDGGRPVMGLLGMPSAWYSHRFGPVEIVVLDGNVPGDPSQLEFLAAALAESEASWQVVVVHHPPHSCGDDHGSSSAVQEHMVPILERGGADLVLSGHDHLYERFAPIDGVTYVVSGGGGYSLDHLGECPEGTPPPVTSLADAFHFLDVRATRTSLEVEAVRVPGEEVVDRFTIGE